MNEHIVSEEKINEYLKHMPKKWEYVIVRATYDNKKGQKVQRKEIVDRINKLAREILDENAYHYFEYNRVIILWDNIPRESYLMDLGYSENHLLKTIFGQKHERMLQIHIEKPETLSRTFSFSEIIEKLYMLWSITGHTPKFMENNFFTAGEFENEYKEDCDRFVKSYIEKRYRKSIDSSASDNVIAKVYNEYNEKNWAKIARNRFMEHKYMEHYERFFKTIEALMQAIKKPIQIVEEPDNFIDLYLKWQKHQISVEEAVDKLPGGSRATWYRYVKAFENSPVYENYTEVFSGEPKRGHIPDPIKLAAYYKKKNEIWDNGTEFLGQYLIYEKDFYNDFDEILSMRDVYRCLDAAMHTIYIYKHKGILKEKVAKYDLTEDDVYDEDFLFWKPNSNDNN